MDPGEIRSTEDRDFVQPDWSADIDSRRAETFEANRDSVRLYLQELGRVLEDVIECGTARRP